MVLQYLPHAGDRQNRRAILDSLTRKLRCTADRKISDLLLPAVPFDGSSFGGL